MFDDLKIERVRESRLASVDFDDLTFGVVFTDHMFSLAYAEGRWGEPAVRPYGTIPMEPGIMTFHYAQSIFEGMKAYRDPDGAIRLFRPDMNARRLNASADFLGLPPLPDGAFEAALKAYLDVDADWVPRTPGCALYLRPLMFSAEPHLEVRPSTRYRFLVIGSPVGSYFRGAADGLRLVVEADMCRVPPSSGMGAAKAAANYAPSLRASRQAIDKGYDQVVWLDGVERRYVEEAGLMNIFVVIDGIVRTPPLNGNILPGVTRDSVLHLLRAEGAEVEETPIAIDEIAAAADAGSLSEMFATGTAAVISPIQSVTYREREHAAAATGFGPVAKRVYDRLTEIQFGRGDDPFGWSRVVVPAARGAEAAA